MGAVAAESPPHLEDPAARVGSVREVVSRALTRLRHDGLIVLDGRRPLVPDEPAPEACAGEDGAA
ncbi:MAG TPA: helix-turn-helix domain-containing protein [Pyrinomonadaceae bacterium]|nr:helix-turn-helix domain-containing protein [Pyrinomonadaceae bacterium]